MPCLTTSGRPEVQGSMILLNGINVSNSQKGEISQGPDTTVQDRSNGGLDWNGDRGKKKKKKEGKEIRRSMGFGSIEPRGKIPGARGEFFNVLVTSSRQRIRKYENCPRSFCISQ